LLISAALIEIISTTEQCFHCALWHFTTSDVITLSSHQGPHSRNFLGRSLEDFFS